jgi:transposase
MAKAGVRGRPIAPLILTAQERAYLERQIRRHRVARSLSERCRVILRCSDGVASKNVAAELGLHEHTVGKWRRRFLKDRCEGLLDEARPGRPRSIDVDQVAGVIERTLHTTPLDATHWSIRSMAVETGFSHTTIRRMWAAFGLQPHRSQTFKLSNDPLFVDKGTSGSHHGDNPHCCSVLVVVVRRRLFPENFPKIESGGNLGV